MSSTTPLTICSTTTKLKLIIHGCFKERNKEDLKDVANQKRPSVHSFTNIFKMTSFVHENILENLLEFEIGIISNFTKTAKCFSTQNSLEI